jgi:hypothetical protein
MAKDCTRLITALVAVLILGLAGLQACAWLERSYIVFADVEQARAQGVFEKGWLPVWLPNQATEIHVYHDLDSNAQAITFSIKGGEDFNWPSECRPAKMVIPPRLKTRKFPRSVHEDNAVQDCDGLFGVTAKGGLVHLWQL